MELGCFSISLSVKDLNESKLFYERLGFTAFAGHVDDNWLVMKNGKTNIGLFQGMFEGNMLTFNPGWDQDASKTDNYTDVREIQAGLKQNGVNLLSEVDGNKDSGPGSFMVTDPDGNVILFDQHV